MSDVERMVSVPLSDYAQLVDIARESDMIVTCETCGAWLHRDDPETAVVEDFIGCWKAATHDSRFDHLCKSHRVIE